MIISPLLAANFTVSLTAYSNAGTITLPHLSAAVIRWSTCPTDDGTMLDDDGDDFPLPGPAQGGADDDEADPFAEDLDSSDDPESSDEDDEDEDDATLSEPGALHLSLNLTAEAITEYQNYQDTCVGLRCVITYVTEANVPVFCHVFDCEDEGILAHTMGENKAVGALEVNLCAIYEVASRFCPPEVAVAK